MKGFILLVSMTSTFAFAAEFDGVPMNCLKVAETRMAKETRMGLVAVCRDRQNPNKEHYTFSDGSRLTGFTTTFTNKKCQVSDWWHGQDDQDQIDQDEWKADCLTSDDF